MPLCKTPLFRDNLAYSLPPNPRIGDEMLIRLRAPYTGGDAIGHEEVRVMIVYGENPNFRVRERYPLMGSPREWVFYNQYAPANEATLEQMLGYSEEEVEDIVAKLRVAPKWYRTTVSKVCDLISWIDHHL